MASGTSRPDAVGSCPACGSPETAKAFEAGGVAFRRCTACRSLFDPAPPGADELRELYEGREYFVKDPEQAEDGSTLWGYPEDYVADRANSEAKFDRVLGHLERYVEPGRLLDVGSGPGFLLTAARARGWDAVGLDVNEWAASYAREELGLEVRLGEIGDAGIAEAELDAITMMDLIEHVPDAVALVEEAAKLVRPGGAIAILTPDAGSPVSRALGARWPEVRRPGEHTILYSVQGLSRLLERCGFVACGWHPIGKVASLATLTADVEPVAPALLRPLREWMTGRRSGERTVEFDPRTKFCLYGRRLPDPERHPGHRAPRIPKRPESLATVETAILEELESLASARRYCDWMFAQFSDRVHGAVAEIGAGIGTFSERILAAGVDSLLLVEPDPACAGVLEGRFADDPRVELVRELLPEAPSLAARAGQLDLLVCQNVLEHIGDDEATLRAMGRSLRPGGHLALVVPANQRLYGALDEAYGHWRRYEPDDLRAVVRAAGLEVVSLRPINASERSAGGRRTGCRARGSARGRWRPTRR